MDHFEALRTLALADVAEARAGRPQGDYVLRRIFRWYSETFHTPLHLVDDLPLDDVLTAYYEANFEGMEEQQFRQELRAASETPAERRAREDKAHLDKLNTWRMENDDGDDDDLDAAYSKARGPVKRGPAAGTLAHQPKQMPAFAPPPVKRGGEMQLPSTEGFVEAIKKTFVSLDEMERLVEMEGLGEIEPLVLDDP